MFDAGAVPDYWVILFFAVVIVEEIVQRHSVRILLTLIQVWGNKKKKETILDSEPTWRMAPVAGS